MLKIKLNKEIVTYENCVDGLFEPQKSVDCRKRSIVGLRKTRKVAENN